MRVWFLILLALLFLAFNGSFSSLFYLDHLCFLILVCILLFRDAKKQSFASPSRSYSMYTKEIESCRKRSGIHTNINSPELDLESKHQMRNEHKIDMIERNTQAKKWSIQVISDLTTQKKKEYFGEYFYQELIEDEPNKRGWVCQGSLSRPCLFVNSAQAFYCGWGTSRHRCSKCLKERDGSTWKCPRCSFVNRLRPFDSQKWDTSHPPPPHKCLICQWETRCIRIQYRDDDI